MATKGQSMVGQDQDDVAYVPITTAQKRFSVISFPGMVRMIMVKARSFDDMANAEKEMTELLRQRHRIGLNKDDDFSVRNLTQMMQKRQNNRQKS